MSLFQPKGGTFAKFPTIGTKVAGHIVEPPVERQATDYQTKQPKFSKKGNPIMEILIKVRDANGTDITIACNYRQSDAVWAALQAAGVPDVEVGGYLEMEYSHDGQALQPGFTAPKEFTARYVPAAQAGPAPAAPAAAPVQQPPAQPQQQFNAPPANQPPAQPTAQTPSPWEQATGTPEVGQQQGWPAQPSY